MASTKSHQAGVKSRCASVKRGLEQAEECPSRVKKMLCTSLNFTIGTPAPDRHSFSARFVSMIDEVLQAEHARLQKEVESKEKMFTELTPAQAMREAALEQAKAHAAEQSTALGVAKQAVTDANAAVKAAVVEVKAAKKAQREGDADLEAITAKKSALETVVKDSLEPIVAGTAEEDTRGEKAKAVMDAGRSHGFDSSLINTAETLLVKPASDRGAFDATCLQQVQDAFATEIAKFDEQLTNGAPEKASRAAAVENAETAQQAAETSQTNLKEKATAAKEAKDSADAEVKAASKSLSDFLPELKAAGDALDAAKAELQSFIEGTQAAFSDLKEFQDNDFQKKAPVKEVEAPEAEPEAAPAVAAE